MGGVPYWYFVAYRADINAALEDLRQREFRAGRYNPVMEYPVDECPISADSPSPGAQHSWIQEALNASGADGTRSILDLDHVSERPDFEAVSLLGDGVLEQLYGTTKPTREMVEGQDQLGFLEHIERGQGIYMVLYKEGKPSEILFAGYSYD